MADQSVGATIDSTRRHLMGNGRSEMNVLFNGTAMTTATAATTGTLTVVGTGGFLTAGTLYVNGFPVTYTATTATTFTGCSALPSNAATGPVLSGTIQTSFPLNGITPGSIIAIDDEEMYVFTTSPGAETAVVSRGENSTTPFYHSQGARIYVNEPFSRAMILEAIIDDIRSWGPQLFTVKTLDIPTSPYQLGYDLGSINPFYQVLEVRLTPPPTFNTSDNRDWKRLRFKYIQDAPLSDFPSGNALILTGQGMAGNANIPIYNYANYQQSLHIIYSAPFDADAIVYGGEGTMLAAQVGIDETEFDIPALGAAWRLLVGREARRATTHLQGEPRSAEEVPPLYISKTAGFFKQMRDGRINDAQYRLMNMYPWRMSS